ncbi:reverse transcriptase domain-containing protein [Tanacetum coccineum]|uniref:Reverse transcriptase domain-containing protein n=1 Tax=Tanacetum coccineum TaxID=301880 RepID=A0ABQ4XKP9_9ASTR
MKVRENDKPSAQHSRFLKMFKQLRLEIGLKDALIEMPKFNKWLSSLLRNKENLEEIAITTVNAECSAIIMNKVPEKLEDPGKFLIPCALQELDRTSALADSGASINLLPHSIYKKLGLEALTPTRMTFELANRSITHPMGIAEDVVVRVDGFTFLADFVVVNFEPDPRVPIILGRPFLRTAKALIDLYEETLTLRVGKEELVYYADKSEKNKNKHFVHAISVIDFSKDDPFSGSTTTHSDDPSPSSSPVKTSDNFEKFADELSPLDSLPPGNDDSTLKKDLHEENFQVYSNPLFEFDDNFKSSTINPLFDEMEENVEIKNSNVFDKPVLLNTPLSDKVAQEDNNDEIDAFLAMEVSSNFEEGYFDSEGDVTFLDNLLSDDAFHNLTSEVISDHEPEQNESSITFSPRSDPITPRVLDYYSGRFEHSTVTYTSVSEDDSHGHQGIYRSPTLRRTLEGGCEEDPEEIQPSIMMTEEMHDDDMTRRRGALWLHDALQLLLIQLTRDPYLLYMRHGWMFHPTPSAGPNVPLRGNTLSAITNTITTHPWTIYVEGSLGSRAAGIRQRDALPVHETEMPEMCLPLRKRSCRTTPGPGYEVGSVRQLDTWDDLVGAIQEIAPTTLEGVNQRVIELSTTVDQEDEIIYSQLDDARYDRALLRARVNRLDSDRPFHRRTALLMDEEARLSRAAWAQSMDACDQVHSEGILLRTTVMAQQSEIVELQAADRRRQSVISDLLKADYRRQRQLVEALKIVKSLKTQMIELQRQQGPAKDPAEPELPEEASSSS